ncbi:hypothetical protein SALBM311S_04116 [Streptomyces alboniger]
MAWAGVRASAARHVRREGRQGFLGGLLGTAWIVASTPAALHQRRALHSWFVVLLFSSVAMALCVTQAERTFTIAAALPALASLACFQQLVRQITLTLPPPDSTSRHRH